MANYSKDQSFVLGSCISSPSWCMSECELAIYLKGSQKTLEERKVKWGGENPALKWFLSFPYSFFWCWTSLEQDPSFSFGFCFPFSFFLSFFFQCPLQYVKRSPQTLTTLQEGVFGYENKADITPRLLSLITASLHALCVCLFPWVAFQRSVVSKISAELFIQGIYTCRVWSLYSKDHKKRRKVLPFLVFRF